jgi:flagellar biosynthesis protein FlhB
VAEDLGDKTEQPTQKRLTDARQRGQVSRSEDLSAAVVLGGAALMLYYFGSTLIEGLGSLMRTSFEPEMLATGVRSSSVEQTIHLTMGVSLQLLVPVLLIMMVIALVDQFAQVGWNVSFEPMTPKIDRLSPAKGIKRIFSRRSVIKALINIAKLIVIATVAMLVVRSSMDRIVASPSLTSGGVALLITMLVTKLAVWIVIALFVIGAIDRFYQSWQHTFDMRMTKQEVKDERKSTEGDPEMKGRRLRMAREIVRQRLQSAVPQADVIVTNPTHYAVAISYDADTMSAPKLVAKGADYMALQIRLIATAHGVPIVERKPLARAIYRSVEVGEEIPADQYEAIAEVLAYVYRLEGRLSSA